MQAQGKSQINSKGLLRSKRQAYSSDVCQHCLHRKEDYRSSPCASSTASTGAGGPSDQTCLDLGDISYLPSPVRGAYFYLYTVHDLFSHRIVDWTVEASVDGLIQQATSCLTLRRAGGDHRTVTAEQRSNTRSADGGNLSSKAS